MDEIKKERMNGRGRSTRSYGTCYLEQRIIYININNRIRQHRTYAHVKYTNRYVTKHKTTYRDILHTLVHELVHYRFNYLQHGAKFEQRIREILRGKVFPQKQLYDDNSDDTNKKNNFHRHPRYLLCYRHYQYPTANGSS